MSSHVQATAPPTTPAPYDSKPFDTGVDSRTHGNAALYDGVDTLWLVGGGEDGLLYATTIQLRTGNQSMPIEKDALQNATWSSNQLQFTSLPNEAKFPPDWRPWCYSMCALAKSGLNNLYLFWNQQSLPPVAERVTTYHNGALLASKCTGATAWSYPYELLDSDGKPIVASGNVDTTPDSFNATTCADVSATAFGADSILVACAVALPGPGDPDWDSDQRGIYLGIYTDADTGADTADPTDPQDVEKATWTASWHTYIAWADLQVFNGGLKSLGYHVSLDWFMTQATDGNPTYMLTLFSDPTFSTQNAPAAWYLQSRLILDENGTPKAVEPAQPPNIHTTSPPWTFAGVEGSQQPCTVRRDPAGRLVATGTSDDPGWTIRFVSYPAMTGENTNDLLPPDTVASVGAKHADERLPVVAYFTDPTDTGAGGLEQHKVFQIWFWSADVRCEVRLYGTIEVLKSDDPNDPLTPYRQGYQHANVVQSIIDGPIPLPNENIASATGEIGGEIAYTDLTGQSTSMQLSSEQTVGTTFEEKFTKGFGPAFKTGFEAGTGSESGSDETTTYAKSKPLAAQIVDNPVTGAEVKPQGVLFCQTPVLKMTAYRFRDASGKLWSDPATTDTNVAPGSVLLMIDLTETGPPVTVPYTPFAVAPGNLYSYTPQAWNARMANLAQRFPNPLLYSRSNYFQDVIEANAHSFGDLNYLEAQWASGSGGLVKTSDSKDSFIGRSWSLDWEFYAGFSGGYDFKLFNDTFEEAFDAEFLTGTRCVDTGKFEQTSTDEWGIELAQGWGPGTAASNAKGAFASYTFRIYFLPVIPGPSPTAAPVNTWTQELRQYLGRGAGDTLEVTLKQKADPPTITVPITYPTPQNPAVEPDPSSIDPGIGCWRIVYVLVAFELTDGTIWTFDPSML
jgi:hypothetical protein